MLMSKKGNQEFMLGKNLNICFCFLQVQGSKSLQQEYNTIIYLDKEVDV